MKTRLFTLAAILLLSAAAMQAQVKVGVIGGVNFQNINGKDDDGVKFDNGLLVGFHGGVNVAIPIAPDFYLQPGLLYSGKGSYNDWGPTPTKASGDYTTTTKLSYIEMPVNLLFRPQFGNGHILLGFGPYLAYAIGGSQKTNIGAFAWEQDIVFTNTVADGSDLINNAYYRPFDAGANIYFGYELSMGLFFQFNAQLGLLKINPEYEGSTGDETELRNTGFGLSAGFRF